MFGFIGRWLSRKWDEMEVRDAKRHEEWHKIMAQGNPYLKGHQVTRFNHVPEKEEADENGN